MRYLLALLLLALPGCAVPLCQKPEAMMMDFDEGPVLIFDTENANTLARMIRDLNEGKCKLVVNGK